MTYELLDSGSGQKLEKFQDYTLIRPCPVAVWKPQKPSLWEKADASFSRENGNRWTFRTKLPKEWMASIEGVSLKISPTDFGHLGVFPEHADLWKWMRGVLTQNHKVLNLFAYSGGATLVIGGHFVPNYPKNGWRPSEASRLKFLRPILVI